MNIEYVVVFAVLLAGVAFAVWLRRTPAPVGHTHLHVVSTPEPKACASCVHFDLAAGRRFMEANPAFMAATTHLQPWQMGRARGQVSEEYLALEREMIRAGEEGRLDEQKALHAKLVALYEAMTPDTKVDPALLALSWDDFGACLHHEELRAQSDACDDWKAR